MKTVVIVIVHPDDLAFGLGGTAWLLKAKYKIHVVCLLAYGHPRLEEQQAECAMLNADLTFLDLNPDAVYAGREICEELAEVLRHVAPVAVFSMWPIDFHPEHAACSEITRRALHLSRVRAEFYMFEEGLGDQTAQFEPDIFVDITAVMDNKLALIRCHPSQGYERLSKRALEQAAFRGMQAHCRFMFSTTEGYVKYAEGFKPLRPIVHNGANILFDLGRATKYPG